MMDCGFNDRVDKVFGSLSSSSSSTWSLTDAPVERREWNRHEAHVRDDDQIPVSSSFQTDDNNDDVDDWGGIRSSIGRDSTLDNEEEEDAYDKMAEGKEDYSDRVYMNDVTDHGPYLNSHNVLPRPLHDPRASRDAAKTRLKEDDDGAVVVSVTMEGSDEPVLNTTEDAVRIKSILKRKSYDDDVAKPAKCVRFDSACKNVDAARPEGIGYGFNDQVDRVFGSFSTSSSSSPWSLTNAHVERRKWNRDEAHVRDDDQIPVSSSFQTNDNDDVDDDDDDDSDWGGIRSSIELDSALDKEEEEDAYDKMAEGNEDYIDRVYMKDVTAKTRLKEDDEGAVVVSVTMEGSDEPMLNTTEDDIIRIKSILKRKSYHDDVAKPAKRVRFDPACKNVDAARPEGIGYGFLPGQVSKNVRSVPDYILNPSKYTRYTIGDCSRDSDGSSIESYLKKSSEHNDVEHTSCGELPKSIVFIPRKKRGDAGCNSEEQIKQSSCSTIGIASVEVQDVDISEMQEDEELNANDICTKAKSQKLVRQYRSKMEEYDDVS